MKNRVHVDLTTSAADRDQEIERLLALGARRVDVGQPAVEFAAPYAANSSAYRNIVPATEEDHRP